jgi:small redox-active disulfide protein 2
MSQDFTSITISGKSVGIEGLDEILCHAASRGISGDKLLKVELLRKAKEKNYIPGVVQAEYAEALLREYKRFIGGEVGEKPAGLAIRILGPGCMNCERLASETKAALAELQLAADVKHVRDPVAISKYGFLATPALIINGQIRSSGRVPSREKIKKWLEEFR